MRPIIILVLLLVPIHSFACAVPPKTLLQSDRELVERSPNIVLAKVTRIEPGKEKSIRNIDLETIEILRGNVPSTFSKQGYEARDFKNAPGDFNGHKMPEFWAYSAGNSILPGDCSAYGLFETNRDYLIFYDAPTHNRSYEQIESQEDLWLNVVRLLINEDNEINNK